MEQDGIISSKKHFGKNTSMRQRERFVSKLHPFLSFSPSLRVYNIYIYICIQFPAIIKIFSWISYCSADNGRFSAVAGLLFTVFPSKLP